MNWRCGKLGANSWNKNQQVYKKIRKASFKINNSMFQLKLMI